MFFYYFIRISNVVGRKKLLQSYYTKLLHSKIEILFVTASNIIYNI